MEGAAEAAKNPLGPGPKSPFTGDKGVGVQVTFAGVREVGLINECPSWGTAGSGGQASPHTLIPSRDAYWSKIINIYRS